MKRFLQGNWIQISIELKNKYSNLSLEDLKCEVGKEEEVLKKLQVRLHKTERELISEFKELITLQA